MPLFWITQQFGWRGLFFLVGGLGVALGVLFWRRYRDPSESTTVNEAELGYIEAGGGGEYTGARVAFSWRHIGRCCGTARSSARRSASSAATRRRCSS